MTSKFSCGFILNADGIATNQKMLDEQYLEVKGYSVKISTYWHKEWSLVFQARCFDAVATAKYFLVG